MRRCSFLTPTGKRIQFVDDPSDATSNTDFYILFSKVKNFYSRASELAQNEGIDYISQNTANRLIQEGLLCAIKK